MRAHRLTAPEFAPTTPAPSPLAGDTPLFGLLGDDRGLPVTNHRDSLTVDQAAAQLTRAGLSWALGLGQGVTVTFAFRASASGMPGEIGGFTPFTQDQIQATLLALQAWSDVSGIVFQRVTDPGSGYSNNAAILFGGYQTGAPGAAAFAYLPGSTTGASSAGDVWVNSNLSYNQSPVINEYGAHVLVHEIGHAIGLLHAGGYNAGAGIDLTYRDHAEYYEDSRQHTVMSYFSESNTSAAFGNRYPAAPMLDDIAAAQRLYGANMTTRTGDTTYGFNSNALLPWLSVTSASTPMICAIWDAGGVDTLDFSGYGGAQRIDLRQGAFSNVGGLTGNVAIAIGAVIENAVGGTGADTIIGNAGDNRFWTGGGGDTIDGGLGIDTLVLSGARGDYQFTWLGRTLFLVRGSVAVQITNVEFVQFSDGPFEVIYSGALIVEGDIAANLMIGSAFGDTLDGNGGDDDLRGLDGGDRLIGGLGDDRLDGGAGDDILDGGRGADRLEGGAGDDTLTGGLGDDILIGGDGNDTADFTSTATIQMQGSTINLAEGWADTSAGRDTLVGIESAIGTAGDDLITGTAGDNFLGGGGGVDIIRGGAGNDVITGGYAHVGGAPDVLKTVDLDNGAVNTAVSLENAFDGIYSPEAYQGSYGATATVRAVSHGGLEYYAFTVTRTGDIVSIDIDGASFDSTLRLLDAQGNVVAFNDDAGVFDPGYATDSLINQALPAGLYYIEVGRFGASQGGGAFSTTPIPAGQTYTLHVNVPNPLSSAFSYFQGCSMYGEEGDDWLSGSIGMDRLDGGSGADTLISGDGDDVLIGGTGSDRIEAGRGNDVAIFAGDRADYVITQFNTMTIVTSADGVDELLDVERLQFADQTILAPVFYGGTSHPDTITGSEFRDEIAGQAGDDVINGMAGDDRLRGDEGHDTLNGGAGADVLEGGAGADVLEGGADTDTLNGGDDNDILLGGAGNDVINGGDGYDIAGYAGVRRGYITSATSVSGGLEGGTDTLTGVEDLAFTDGRLTFARDSQAAQVMRLYDAALDRAPDQSGFEALLDTLEHGILTLQQLAAEFVNSVEFQNRFGSLSDRQYVEQLYVFSLNRTGDEPGIQNWVNALQGGGMTRAQVLVAFSESAEHKDIMQGRLDQGLWVADEQTLMVARLYDATYDRLPDQQGLQTWRDALGGGMDLMDIAQAFATAPEFLSTYGSLSNREFVELMYQLCLNRNGDAQGVATWTAALEGGMSRGEVLFHFSESDEHIALTRDTFLGGVPCIDMAASPATAETEAKSFDDGVQVIPMSPDAGLEDGGKDTRPIILPGVTDDGFLIAKIDVETQPQVLLGPDSVDRFDLADFLMDIGHNHTGLEGRLTTLFLETAEQAPGIDSGIDAAFNLRHEPDPWAA